MAGLCGVAGPPVPPPVVGDCRPDEEAVLSPGLTVARAAQETGDRRKAVTMVPVQVSAQPENVAVTATL